VLVRRGADPKLARAAAAAALLELPGQLDLSSAHMLFPTEEEATDLEARGLVRRSTIQFQWHNQGFATYEDFLATLPSKRRTQIRRERRAPREQGLTIETLRDEQLSPALADEVFELYAATVDKFHWGRRYLTRGFFEEVLGSMKSSIEVVVAREGSRTVAGAFNVRGAHALYGRYWGARADVPFLHFNVCYYHPVAECIERKIPRFEPGAGGEHKLARGFSPTIVHSIHHLVHPGLRRAVGDFCDRERAALLTEIARQ
jgi:predicted N-acyltransferase